MSGSEQEGTVHYDSKVDTITYCSPIKEVKKKQIGQYVLGRILGKGVTGIVREATYCRNNQKVALKIIKKKYLDSKPKLWKKVKREIAILKMMEHPHVMKLYDFFETTKSIYLVTEFVSGGELFDYIAKNGPLSRSEALRMLSQIVLGLEHCHNKLICHRDLKPENILLDADKNVKIGDFGMAQLMLRGLLTTSCGSPHYASPEVIKGIPYDGRAADVWSCGVIFFALVTSALPFDHESIPKLLDLVERGCYYLPDSVDKDISELIAAMLTVDPRKRISMQEIKAHAVFQDTEFFHVPYATSTEPCLLRPQSPASPLPTSPTSPISPTRKLLEERKRSSSDGGSGDVDSSELDEDTLGDLEALGWGTTRYLRSKILNTDPTNTEKQLYQLMLNRKKNRQQELTRPLSTTSTSSSSTSTTTPLSITSPSTSPASSLILTPGHLRPQSPGLRSRFGDPISMIEPVPESIQSSPIAGSRVSSTQVSPSPSSGFHSGRSSRRNSITSRRNSVSGIGSGRNSRRNSTVGVVEGSDEMDLASKTQFYLGTLGTIADVEHDPTPHDGGSDSSTVTSPIEETPTTRPRINTEDLDDDSFVPLPILPSPRRAPRSSFTPKNMAPNFFETKTIERVPEEDTYKTPFLGQELELPDSMNPLLPVLTSTLPTRGTPSHHASEFGSGITLQLPGTGISPIITSEYSGKHDVPPSPPFTPISPYETSPPMHSSYPSRPSSRTRRTNSSRPNSGGSGGGTGGSGGTTTPSSQNPELFRSSSSPTTRSLKTGRLPSPARGSGLPSPIALSPSPRSAGSAGSGSSITFFGDVTKPKASLTPQTQARRLALPPTSIPSPVPRTMPPPVSPPRSLRTTAPSSPPRMLTSLVSPPTSPPSVTRRTLESPKPSARSLAPQPSQPTSSSRVTALMSPSQYRETADPAVPARSTRRRFFASLKKKPTSQNGQSPRIVPMASSSPKTLPSPTPSGDTSPSQTIHVPKLRTEPPSDSSPIPSPNSSPLAKGNAWSLISSTLSNLFNRATHDGKISDHGKTSKDHHEPTLVGTPTTSGESVSKASPEVVAQITAVLRHLAIPYSQLTVNKIEASDGSHKLECLVVSPVQREDEDALSQSDRGPYREGRRYLRRGSGSSLPPVAGPRGSGMGGRAASSMALQSLEEETGEDEEDRDDGLDFKVPPHLLTSSSATNEHNQTVRFVIDIDENPEEFEKRLLAESTGLLGDLRPGSPTKTSRPPGTPPLDGGY